MLRIVGLLEDVALWRRLSSRVSLHVAAFIFPSTLTSLSVLGGENILTADAATTMLHCNDGNSQVMSGAWFLPDTMLDIGPDIFAWLFFWKVYKSNITKCGASAVNTFTADGPFCSFYMIIFRNITLVSQIT